MNFIGGVRYVQLLRPAVIRGRNVNTVNRAGFFLGLLAGGPAAIWYDAVNALEFRTTR